ncbi:glycosyltransferase involved in cell wall biosynthesis [Arcticibacter pallidicorallinus]|uniref:Glycosyltransferase involved in cell wall biosynthesis n=1 Tax=Arcticibacter pallidicorallinus TaxID=1259464 RepID=A0A2T0UBH3_9SPHI|nr:glycosyltransferase family 4 protein [Arcticibacter pallidicorallinus]PRY55290.1 glycosyltransferase involved in cell wall biosynthesis [Arcticibacter pallidicorallinus]
MTEKTKVVYYTHVYYLDAALEYIKQISLTHSVYVFIELGKEGLKANIFDLDIDLSAYPPLVSFYDVKSKWNISELESYFVNTKETYFLTYANPQSLSLLAFKRAINFVSQLRRIQPDYVHFEDLSLRQVWMLPYLSLNPQKLVINAHDPLPHSGESMIKRKLLKSAFFFFTKKYVCFSEFSKNQLRGIVSKKSDVYLIKLLPYTVYSNYQPSLEVMDRNITFVGRLSPYKGIDLFLNAIKLLGREDRVGSYVVAGKRIGSYDPGFAKFTSKSLQVIDKHLSNDELVKIILNSKLIVCPYLDATQSGVIMTAYALNRPVLVTPVGGLPEYVQNGVTGLIMHDVDTQALIKSLEFFERHETDFSDMSLSIKEWRKRAVRQNNEIIESIYKKRKEQ